MSTAVALRPGTPVLAREPGIVQVGLTGPRALLPDDPDVHRLLVALDRPGGTEPDDETLGPAAALALARLEEAGLVVSLTAADQTRDPTAITLRAQFGPDAVRRQAARSATGVAVGADPATLLLLEPLLALAGVGVVAGPEEPAAVRLVVVTGTVDRASLDPFVRDTVPHLVVAGSALGRRIGPFVEPGRTACLRCVDAHESLSDQRQPLLLAQAAHQAARRPPPTDPVLDRMVLAWAVQDLCRYLEGDEPSSWSTTIDVAPSGAPVVTRWGRHPYCGCAWDTVLELP